MTHLRFWLGAAFAAALATAAQAQNAPGVTATEIKIGNTMPWSGPASALSTTGKTIAAYLDQVNEQGGVNGRKITMISLDDGFSPPKTMEAARRLVEGEGVAFIAATMGTAPSSAIAKYLNSNKVPQIFLISSASKWNDPQNMPWSMALPWAPNYLSEAKIEVAYARAKNPNARFAVLYQNDDAGKDFMRGVKEALGPDADKAIALASSFEVADPTVDSQVLTLAATKADVFMIYSVTPRACAQALRKAHEVGWQPMRFIASGCANKATVMDPAGVDAGKGVLSLGSLKPYAADPKDDKAMQTYIAFMKARLPALDPNNVGTLYGYTVGEALVALLKQCGNDLSRENIMKQAANMQNVSLSLLLPGITLNTSPTDFRPIKDGYMLEFNGADWVVVSEMLRGT
ncbi:ABC transporter substrate-binding protein [Rhodopseudomonas palustris]|uniref:Branched-chain amino acid ABC transporter substrate-binding protein n=1 Tax=Rhodopseudomonas palustris TaxID=1076 RepID=A0A418V4E5_RHOPL|nr:ABC transporter substrate-binding protein [Rhodopseudomonas palustris]RJF70915.1 branched-chain amino acid ABC transporter substrate-binding protein [Rhodopseudomonas palustris]